MKGRPRRGGASYDPAMIDTPAAALDAVPPRTMAKRAGTLVLAAMLALAPGLAAARTPAAAEADPPRVTTLPAVPAERLDAAHWIARWPDAEAVALDAAAVQAHNARLFELDASVTRLDALPDAMGAAERQRRIRALSSLPATPLWFEDGRPVGDADRARWEAALNLDARDPDAGVDTRAQHRLRWALVTRRAALRRYPTDERVFSAPGQLDLDRFQESAFFPGTPVAVLHDSADGRWRFVVGATYAAWVLDEALAYSDKATVLGYPARAGRVVLEPVARLAHAPEAPAVSGLALDMGVALPERRDWPTSQAVNGQSALASVVVEMPTRDADGALRLVPALLPRAEASHDGPLPASRANVLRQAFRFLGERYGWGHDDGARDCSGFVGEVYRSVGLALPRNTGDQARSPALSREPLEGLDRASRLAAIGRLAPGDLVYLPGHVAMVVGHDEAGPWVIHSVHRLRTRKPDGTLRAWPANGTVLTPLRPLQFDESRDYVDAATALVRVLPSP